MIVPPIVGSKIGFRLRMFSISKIKYRAKKTDFGMRYDADIVEPTITADLRRTDFSSVAFSLIGLTTVPDDDDAAKTEVVEIMLFRVVCRIWIFFVVDDVDLRDSPTLLRHKQHRTRSPKRYKKRRGEYIINGSLMNFELSIADK